MPRRPESRALKAMGRPWPSSPSRRSASMTAPSQCALGVCDDLAAECLAFLGVGDRGAQCGLGEARRARRDAEAAGVEGAEGDGQALALLAEQAVGLDDGAVPVRAGGG